MTRPPLGGDLRAGLRASGWDVFDRTYVARLELLAETVGQARADLVLAVEALDRGDTATALMFCRMALAVLTGPQERTTEDD